MSSDKKGVQAKKNATLIGHVCNWDDDTLRESYIFFGNSPKRDCYVNIKGNKNKKYL